MDGWWGLEAGKVVVFKNAICVDCHCVLEKQPGKVDH